MIDLDKDRPARYVRNFKPHTPGGYLPEYQPTQIPEERNDLKKTILRQRRPDLYLTLAPQKPTPPRKARNKPRLTDRSRRLGLS